MKKLFSKKSILIIVSILILSFLIWTLSSFTQSKKNSDSEKTESTLFSIVHWNTAQGTPVYFVPLQGLPIVDVALIFDAGSTRDGKKFGLASLCSNMMEEGSEKWNAEEIAERLEDQGALFDIKTDRDKTWLRFRSLNDPKILDTVIETITEVVAHPSFTEDALNQLKNQTLVELQKNKQQPNVIAIENFMQNIYGQHPYGHLIAGTEQTIPEISQNDCKNFHTEFFVSKNAKIVIVGGIDKKQAEKLAETLLSKLEPGQTAAALPEVANLEKSLTIKKPFSSQQSHIYLGQPGQIVGDKDYFPLLVGNYILGQGSLVSRLFQEVREKKGLAYVATSSVEPFKKPGPFLIYLQTKGSNTQEAEATIRTVLQDFIEKGPTDTELTAAKKALIGSFPLSLGSNLKITEVVSDMLFYDLPLDFLKNYRDNIQKVTLEDIQDAFKRRIHPEKMVLVVVGQSE